MKKVLKIFDFILTIFYVIGELTELLLTDHYFFI